MVHLDGNKMIETKRRGISTFIATLLLMVLAVSAGVVIYAYTMGYLGNFGGPQTMGAISVDTYSLDVTASASKCDAYIRNIGKAQFELQSIYIDGKAVTGTVPTLVLKEGEVKLLSITEAIKGTAFVGSTTYEIKLIGKDNTQLSFQVKK